MNFFLFVQQYRLENVTTSDEGWYTCEVTNEFGVSYSSGLVTVLLEEPEGPEAVRKK